VIVAPCSHAGALLLSSLALLPLVLRVLSIQPADGKQEKEPRVGVFYGSDLEMAYIISVFITLGKTQLWLHLTARWARICNFTVRP